MYDLSRKTRMFTFQNLGNLIFMVLIPILLLSCQRELGSSMPSIEPTKGFSLEECARQLVIEKYPAQMNIASSSQGMTITQTRADKVKVQIVAYDTCSDPVATLCQTGAKTARCSAEITDLIIMQNGEKCRVIFNKTYYDDGAIICPTSEPILLAPTRSPATTLTRPSPSSTPKPTIIPTLTPTREYDLAQGETIDVANTGQYTSLPFSMPEYYLSNPALRFVGMVDTIGLLSVIWEDNSRFKLVDDYLDPSPNQPDISWLTDNYRDILVAPDGTKALVIARRSQSDFEPAGEKISDEIMDPEYFDQFWVINPDTKTIINTLYSQESYSFDWTEGSRYLVGIGSCYGEVGYGLLTIDAKTSQVHVLNEGASLCEGVEAPLVAPDSEHLVFQGKIYPVDGTRTSGNLPFPQRLLVRRWAFSSVRLHDRGQRYHPPLRHKDEKDEFTNRSR